jgi:hypothetical protein
MSHIVRAPTPASTGHVTGYRCDDCEQVHIVMQLRFAPPDSMDHDEDVVMVFQIPEVVARHLVSEMTQELEHPAPGYQGGTYVPIVLEEGDETET